MIFEPSHIVFDFDPVDVAMKFGVLQPDAKVRRLQPFQFLLKIADGILRITEFLAKLMAAVQRLGKFNLEPGDFPF